MFGRIYFYLKLLKTKKEKGRFVRDTLWNKSQATQGSFEILAREDIDSESASLDKRVRVVATVTYQLR